MPRIRSVKPEFWQDSRMARLPALERLVFLCTWSMADDEGRIEGDAMAVWRFGSFREDSREIASALETLRSIGRLVLYEVEGNPYIQIVNFRKHQRIDHATKSKYPAPTEGCDLLSESSRVIREPSRILAPDLEQGAGSREQGSGTGRGVEKPKGRAFALPGWIPAEPWTAYCEMRTRIKKPMTNRAKELAVDALQKLRDDGQDCKAVLEQSVFKSWQGLFPVNGSSHRGVDDRNRATVDNWVKNEGGADARN